MFEAIDPPEIVLFLGRFHPLLVHLPIGFLLIGFLLDLISRLPGYQVYRHAVSFVLFLGALTSILAAGLGYLLSLGGGYDDDLLNLHMWLGIGVSVAAVGALFLKIRLSKHPSLLRDRFYFVTLSLTVLLMMGAGHYGGSLTHGSGYLTAYLPTSMSAFTSGASSKKQVKVITDLPEALVYTDIVQPIFDSRCTSCHNQTKKKGDLRLDNFDGILTGGKGGSVVQPGQAHESELYKRLLLPPEDEDSMPPKGKEPLTETELQLIAWWINEGAAKADKKVKDLAQNATVKIALENRMAAANQWVNPVFAKKIDPVSQQVLEAADRAGFLVLPLAKGQPFMRAQIKMGAPAPMDLSALAPLADQLVVIDLSGIPLSEDLLAAVGTFQNLTRLHIENTKTTDAGIAHLVNLPYLEYLNVYGNPITDEGIMLLMKVPHLRKLYLWQTEVTPAGVAALKQKQQKLQIVTGVSGIKRHGALQPEAQLN